MAAIKHVRLFRIGHYRPGQPDLVLWPSPSLVYPIGAIVFAGIEPNTTLDSYFGCGWTDWNILGPGRQWLDMIFKFASAQKMTSAGVFYAFPFSLRPARNLATATPARCTRQAS